MGVVPSVNAVVEILPGMTLLLLTFSAKIWVVVVGNIDVVNGVEEDIGTELFVLEKLAGCDVVSVVLARLLVETVVVVGIAVVEVEVTVIVLGTCVVTEVVVVVGALVEMLTVLGEAELMVKVVDGVTLIDVVVLGASVCV